MGFVFGVSKNVNTRTRYTQKDVQDKEESNKLVCRAVRKFIKKYSKFSSTELSKCTCIITFFEHEYLKTCT